MFFTALFKKTNLSLKIILVGIVIVIVILIGVGIFLTIRNFNYSPSPEKTLEEAPEKILEEAPEKILEEALVNFGQIKTFHFDISFEKEIKQSQQETTKKLMTVKGNLDNASKEMPEWKGETEIKSVYDGGEFLLGWEKIIIGEEEWFKLTILPASQFLKIFSFDIKNIKDQWIKLEKESFKDLFSRLSALSEIEVVKKIITNEKIFRFIKKLPDEKVDGEDCYRYSFVFEKEEFEKLIPEIAEITPIKTDELYRRKEVNVEILIDKENKLIKKMKIESEVQPQELEIASGERTNIKIEIYLSEFNKQLKIEPPQHFKFFEDIFGKKDFNFFPTSENSSY